MTNRANANFLEVFLRQLRQDALVDLVLAKASLVLLKAKASEPVADIQWSLTLVGHDAGLCRPERTCLGGPHCPWRVRQCVPGVSRPLTAKSTSGLGCVSAGHKDRDAGR